MAKATTTTSDVTFVLELDEREAQYVLEALRQVNPAHIEGDPVWDALDSAMKAVGIGADRSAILTG